ncbi:MAG: hypothetical protein U9P79_06175, partial [Candidatus Cloacimonadota bacterium]|nr:hypothetical protein [Candidatus Cloacimonadota bacterium]
IVDRCSEFDIKKMNNEYRLTNDDFRSRKVWKTRRKNHKSKIVDRSSEFYIKKMNNEYRLTNNDFRSKKANE